MNAIAAELSPERFSPRSLARLFGGIGLFGIAAGFFDIGYVYSHIVSSGDAGTTAFTTAVVDRIAARGASA